MTDEERGLLEAIRAEPEEDDARLVYADWLEERGQDERAELVRVQLAIERDGPSEPLLARERDLLTRRAAEWLGPWADACLRFDRGMAVACWTTLPQFEAGTARLAGAGDPPWVAERWLHLGGARFEGESFRAFVRSPGFGRLTRFHLDRLRGRGGELWGRPVSAAMTRELAASPLSANLRRLWLVNGDVGDRGARALAESPHLGRLRWLSLRLSPLTAEGVAALAGSAALSGLTALRLSWEVAAGEGPVRALAAARGLSRLGSLNVWQNRIGDARLRRLLTAPWVGRLRELWLGENRIGDGGAREVAGCPALSGLRLLDLTGNRLSDAGARALLESPHLRNLRRLSLRYNSKVSDRLHERVERRYGEGESRPQYYSWLDWRL